MLATLAAALLTIVAALVLGAALVTTFAPRLPRAAIPGIGYAALILVAAVVVRAPGQARTGFILIAALVLLAGWRVRDERPHPDSVAGAVVCVAAVLAVLLLPFLAAGHFGPLGVSMDDDLGFHVGWVYDLAHGPPPFGFFKFGYPLGGESLAACLTWLGLGDEPAFVGVTAGAIALTSLAAFAALGARDRRLRLPLAIACGLPYLTAGYFGEGSFKEPEMGLIVLTFALTTFAPNRSRWGGAAAVLLLSATTTLIFGPPGLIWPVAFVLAREFADRWAPPRTSQALAHQVVLALAALGVVALVAVVANAVGRRLGASGFQFYLGGPPAHDFGGDFARALPLTEGFGVWFGRDFRYGYSGGLIATAAVVLAVVLFAAAAAARLRAWRTTLLLPAAAAIVVYLGARLTTIPYFSAKLLVGIGPLVLLFVFDSLLSLRGATWAKAKTALPLGLSLLLAVAVVWSSAEALRASPVDDPAFGAELESFRPLVVNHTVVYLGADQWAPEWLRGASSLSVHGFKGRIFPIQPQKSDMPPYDFDTVYPSELNTADYIVTTRTLDASSPPSNWVLVRTTAHYELWARRGTAPARSILDEQNFPGATLDCSQRPGRALAAKRGVAAVRTPPAISSTWRNSAGKPLASAAAAAVYMTPGETAFSTLRPMRGPVELSLTYSSSFVITVQAGTASVRLTPTLEPFGPLWRFAVISTGGRPVTIRVHVLTGHVPISNSGAVVGPIYAVPDRPQDTIVPLRDACGRYVDWYRLAG